MKSITAMIFLILFLFSGYHNQSSSLILEEQAVSLRQDDIGGTADKKTESTGALQENETALKDDPISLLKNVSYDDLEYLPTAAGVADINGDQLPEIILQFVGGWEYQVYYYANGAVQRLDGMTAWAWSTNLFISSNNELVLYIWAHTTGTAGNLQYRIYDWDGSQYSLTMDLSRAPSEWDWSGVPFSHRYFISDTFVDLKNEWDQGLENLYEEITQQEFDAKIASLGELTYLQLQPQSYEQESDQEIFKEYLKKELDAWQ